VIAMRPTGSLATRLTTRRDAGASAAEYAIVVTLIAVVIAVGVAAFGLAVAGLFAVPGGL
jgi:Flp pilus assembly pilin Flp